MLHPAFLQLARSRSACGQQRCGGTGAGTPLGCPQARLKPGRLPPRLCAKGSGHRETLQRSLLGGSRCQPAAFRASSRAGGEGSVLAAACSVVGVGSDIGGSIRMPAFFNGVFGHKPTAGRAGGGPPRHSSPAAMLGGGARRGRSPLGTVVCPPPVVLLQGDRQLLALPSPLREQRRVVLVGSRLAAKCQPTGGVRVLP